MEEKQYTLSGNDVIPRDKIQSECNQIINKIRNLIEASSLQVSDDDATADYFNDADKYLQTMNELFSDFHTLMPDASSKHYAHADALIQEPTALERNQQIQKIVAQAIQIYN